MRISCGHEIGSETDEEILTYLSSFYAATNRDKLSDLILSLNLCTQSMTKILHKQN